ncbi:MAG: Dehydrogenase/decarboxylase protein [Mycobacterium sp.]|jgi:hypothetical protein|nr:Dehydrogenase/decarboxylase protein [Mycobacterium sp.]
MMRSHQEQVQALDPAFARMATEVGLHAWSLPQLTMREKTSVPGRRPMHGQSRISACHSCPDGRMILHTPHTSTFDDSHVL